MNLVKIVVGLFWLLIVYHKEVIAQHTQLSKDSVVIISVPVDRRLVMPVGKEPAHLCQSLHQVWATYLRIHQNFKKDYSMDENDLGYLSSIIATIDNRGVMHTSKKAFYSRLELQFYVMLKPVLNNSRWIPLYRKTSHRKEAIQTSVCVYISLDKLYNARFYIRDLKTDHDIFKCSTL